MKLLALLALFCAAFSLCAQTRSPSLFAADSVRSALKEQGVAPPMETLPRTTQELREVVSRRLDSKLLAQSRSIFGRDFHFKLADARVEQLGVIVLRYESSATAKQKASILAPLKNYFRNSKILTRFSAVPLENLLLVAYSENSGDAKMVDALDKIAADFAGANAGTIHWEEPGH